MDIFAKDRLPAKDDVVKGEAYRVAMCIPAGQAVTQPPPAGYAYHWAVTEPAPGTEEADAALRLLNDMLRSEGGTRYIAYPTLPPTQCFEKLTDAERCELFGINCPEAP